MSSARGVRIVGSGLGVPSTILTNQNLEAMMETTDDWIVQRTGIHSRYRCDPAKGEGVLSMSIDALSRALADARLKGADLDLVILATCTAPMSCPSGACRLAHAVGATPAGAFDLAAACSGFVFGINVADSLIKSGSYRRIGVVGADSLTSIADYTNRRVSILSGDGAGAVVLEATDDVSKGCLFQSMYSDGSLWDYLYIPHKESDVPKGADWNEVKLHSLQMKGREVFKFAVTRFPEALSEAFEKSGTRLEDVAIVIAHQSNARIIEASRRRLGFSEDHFYLNIDRYGNTSAGSVPICFDELRRAGRIREGDLVAFIAMGGGMTWGTSLWRL